MKDKLYQSINTVAYFLWEYTKSENALGLWLCAEDMANIFEENEIFCESALNEIISLGRNNNKYREFVRVLSYRIHNYTGELNTVKNWFITEKLLANSEWKQAVISASKIFRSCVELKNNQECQSAVKSIRNEQIRNYYIKKMAKNSKSL